MGGSARGNQHMRCSLTVIDKRLLRSVLSRASRLGGAVDAVGGEPARAVAGDGQRRLQGHKEVEVRAIVEEVPCWRCCLVVLYVRACVGRC